MLAVNSDNPRHSSSIFPLLPKDEADNFSSPLPKDEVILGIASKERVNSNRQFILFHSANIFGHAVCYYIDPTLEEVWFLGYQIFFMNVNALCIASEVPLH